MASSIQGIQSPSTASVYPVSGVRSRIKQDVQTLSKALSSGDLATAQKSYADLQKLLKSNGAISQASTGSASGVSSKALSTVRDDFNALGQALQSGDLTGAQSDFAQLSKDSQALAPRSGDAGGVAGHRHHIAGGDGDGDGGGSQASSPNATAATASTSTSTLTDGTATAPRYALQQASAYSVNFSGSLSGAAPAAGTDTSQLSSDLQTIGKDLRAGNLDTVQKDFGQAVSDAQKLFGPAPGSNAAYQYSLSASYENATATSAGNTQSVDYQSASFQATLQGGGTETSTPSASNGYQFSVSASGHSQSISVLS